MKKWIALILVLTMVLAMSGCGCNHPEKVLQLTDVDTAKLTAKQVLTCTKCGKVLEKQDTATGIAPANGTMYLSAADWFACLTTNITTYDTSRMLVPMGVESEDGAILRSLVSPSGFKSVISFFDKDGNVITTEQGNTGSTVHRICIEAQFDNATATTFYTMLMLMAMTNNSEWTSENMNALAQGIMQGETLTDNGYTYNMQILNAALHTVSVDIIAE